MRVLALTHGPSVGPGVFGDAVQDGRARARRVAGPARRPGAGGCRCRDRPRRCDASRRGRAPRLADDGAALARGPARPRHPAARRLPRLAARRPGGRRGGLPLGGVGGRLVPGRVHGRRDGRPRRGRVARAVRRLPVASLHAHAPRRRGRAGPQRGLHPGLPGRERVGRPVPPGGAGGAGRGVARRRIRRTSPTRKACGAQTRARIAGWNELGRGLCRAFLAAA